MKSLLTLALDAIKDCTDMAEAEKGCRCKVCRFLRAYQRALKGEK